MFGRKSHRRTTTKKGEKGMQASYGEGKVAVGLERGYARSNASAWEDKKEGGGLGRGRGFLELSDLSGQTDQKPERGSS